MMVTRRKSHFSCQPVESRARRCRCLSALVVLGALAGGGLSGPELAAREASRPKVQLPGPSDAPGEKSIKPLPHKPADFKSTHFLIHTDLSSKEAHELLKRLEQMLVLVAKYWNHPPVATIECYVVKDLKHWPAGSLLPAGRAKIQQGAGVTIVETLNRGAQTVAAKAIVYATAEHGTPQHEAVHAYCGQAFGKTGPLWYSEGMAEVGQYWRPDELSVNCPDYVIRYIRSRPPKPLGEILGEGRPGNPNGASGDSWQNYAWRWALCHLLVNNPNYSARFRPLGAAYLSGGRASFAEVFGSMLEEVAFEYRFFVEHVERGYRVDLCKWDWQHKFKELTGDSNSLAHVAANRGWQPSGAIVSSAKQYDYSASGTWQTSKDEPETTADGQPDGHGRLEGVIFNDYALGQPFELGAYGSFTPPADGRLFLRCRDEWNQLADNKGSLTVKIKRSGQGSKLPRPAGKGDRPTKDAAEEPVETTAKRE